MAPIQFAPKGKEFQPFIEVVSNFPKVAPMLLGLSQVGFINGETVYRRMARSGRKHEWSRFGAENFKKHSALLSDFFVPRLEMVIPNIKRLLEFDHEIPVTVFKELDKQNRRIAYKVNDAWTGVNMYLMTPTEDECNLVVVPTQLKDAASEWEVESVLTLLAYKKNKVIECFLLNGDRIVPAVGDFGDIGDIYEIGSDGRTHHPLPIDGVLRLFNQSIQ